ncbi:MAG: rhomboid family intramembrane serine protease [Planctomycetia bacterium]|nr:rhomboid family intramembrane serine protease [Planctomycetia bacterium]
MFLVQLDFRRTPVTLSLMALMIALEIVCIAQGSDARNELHKTHLGLTGQVWEGEYWRPLTTTLLHGGLMHLAMNMLAFAVFGGAVEHDLGSPRTAAVIVFLAFVSSLPELAIWGARGVGFSGVVFGLFGWLMVARHRKPELYVVCPPQTVTLMTCWFLLGIAATAGGFWNIANTAHGAGWLFGALLGLTMFRERRRVWWALATSLLATLILATMFLPQGLPAYKQWRLEQKQEAERELENGTPPAPNGAGQDAESETGRAP